MAEIVQCPAQIEVGFNIIFRQLGCLAQILFSLAILSPALILGFFGVRALVQEGLLQDRQIQDRLDAIAKSTGLRLESELNAWDQAVVDLARSKTTNPADWPEQHGHRRASHHFNLDQAALLGRSQKVQIDQDHQP